MKKKAGLLGGPMAAEPVDPYWKQALSYIMICVLYIYIYIYIYTLSYSVVCYDILYYVISYYIMLLYIYIYIYIYTRPSLCTPTGSRPLRRGEFSSFRFANFQVESLASHIQIHSKSIVNPCFSGSVCMQEFKAPGSGIKHRSCTFENRP